MLVSILVNNYNYSRFLPRCLKSALNQTYKDIEVVVVDDGSTDDSRNILQEFASDPRVTLIFKENGGQASCLNAGFQRSSGRLLFLLDADDECFPNRVETIVAAAIENPNAAAIIHNLQRSDLGIPWPGTHLPAGLRRIEACFLLTRFVWNPMSPTSGMCLNRDLILPLFPVPEEPYRLCADAYLHCFLSLQGPILAIPSVLGLYRIHGHNSYVGSSRRAQVMQLVHINLLREASARGLNPIVPEHILWRALVDPDFPDDAKSLLPPPAFWLYHIMVGPESRLKGIRTAAKFAVKALLAYAWKARLIGRSLNV